MTEATAAADSATPSADSTTPPTCPASRPQPAGPHIELRGVHVSYPGAPNEALSGIDLQIPAGQYVCILGGNGSGKSTLLQLMNALALPSAGEVRVFGVNTSEEGAPLAIRSRCASVFQHPEDQMVTSIVADDVAFGPENLCVPQPEIASRVDASLEAVGMSEHSQSDPADLSGGQTQRVAIAGALAMEPEILLLDEPCAMLDTQGRSSIRAIVNALRKRGITIVHVTHFMEDALDADRVLVLERGRIAFDRTAAEAFACDERVQALHLEAPRKSAEIFAARRTLRHARHPGPFQHPRHREHPSQARHHHRACDAFHGRRLGCRPRTRPRTGAHRVRRNRRGGVRMRRACAGPAPRNTPQTRGDLRSRRRPRGRADIRGPQRHVRPRIVLLRCCAQPAQASGALRRAQSR